MIIAIPRKYGVPLPWAWYIRLYTSARRSSKSVPGQLSGGTCRPDPV